MRRSCLAALLAGLISLLLATPAQPAAAPVVRATKYGFSLSLSLPGTSFARDALVRVTLTLHNGSGRPATSWPGRCPHLTLEAQALDVGNVALYPPALDAASAPFTGCASGTFRLAPGQTVVRHQILLVRAAKIRGLAELDTGGKIADIVTPVVRVRLTAASRPRITFHTSPQLSAQVRPPSGAQGHLTYSQYLACSSTHHAILDDTALLSRWHTVSGIQITPKIPASCGHVIEWYLLAGWAGFPVAQADYCAAAALCQYSQTPAVGARASTDDGRVRLILTLPAKTYPRNALVPATIKLENHVSHVIWYNDACPLGVLSLEVTTNQGGLVYPPAVPGTPTPHCPRATATPLPPGHLVQRTVLAVLRGSNIHALANLGRGSHQSYFETPNIAVQLTTGQPPAVTLNANPLSATLTPATPPSGPLYEAAWTGCYSSADRTGQSSYGASFPEGFAALSGNQIVPQIKGPCAFQEWHAVAGWIGQPVATIDYLSPGLQPKPAERG